ncbi:MAG: type II secretion system protein GspL [Halioglobus sp.]
MQNLSIVRLVGHRLAWYPPGAGEEPRWLDDDVARAALKSALAQRRTGVCFAAPGEDVRLLTLPVSSAERRHIARSLPYSLEEQVAADIDSLHFAHVPLDKQRYAVAICARSAMHEWQARLAEFPGLNRWVPEPLLLPWRRGEWCLVLEEDRAIVRCGECEGFAIERPLVATLLESLLGEGDVPAAVVVYGRDQAADIALVPEALRGAAQWRGGNLYSAMLLSDDEALNLNLLQGDYALRLPLGRWWKQWRAVAATFAAVCVLQMGAVYADYRNLSAQNQALRAAVQESYRKAFPQGQVVDAEKQLRRQLDGLRGTAQGSGFVSLVAQVGEAVAGMPNTSVATINYNDRADEMRMNIVAADFEGVEKLRSRINENGLEAVMESSSAQGDAVRARIRVGKGS